MSELSSAYSEYERISGLFRQLNEAALATRRTLLGIDPPSIDEQRIIRDQLDEALKALGEESENNAALGPDFSLSELLESLPEDGEEVSAREIVDIRRRIKSGLPALTDDDLSTIERISAALDSRSEVLFRRIQK